MSTIILFEDKYSYERHEGSTYNWLLEDPKFAFLSCFKGTMGTMPNHEKNDSGSNKVLRRPISLQSFHFLQHPESIYIGNIG